MFASAGPVPEEPAAEPEVAPPPAAEVVPVVPLTVEVVLAGVLPVEPSLVVQSSSSSRFWPVGQPGGATTSPLAIGAVQSPLPSRVLGGLQVAPVLGWLLVVEPPGGTIGGGTVLPLPGLAAETAVDAIKRAPAVRERATTKLRKFISVYSSEGDRTEH